MRFRVILTAAANSDIRDILAWLAMRSASGALAWYRRWLTVLCELADAAEGFGVAPENERHPEPIRQVLFKTRRGRTYRALFVVRGSDVFVLHVRGPGQRPLEPGEIISPD